MRRPTPAEIAAAAGSTIDDVLAPGLDVVFVGINPGLYSGATGHHFARPGNRFWKALHLAGFTDRVLEPAEQRVLLEGGAGVTNLVARATATAAELSPDELREGAGRLERKLRRLRPRVVAFLGIGAYRVALGEGRASVGEQPRTFAGARVWVLPNPSGLNASYQLPQIAEAFADVKGAARAGVSRSSSRAHQEHGQRQGGRGSARAARRGTQASAGRGRTAKRARRGRS